MPGPVPPIPAAGTTIAGSPGAGASATRPEEPWVTRGDGTYRVTPVSPGRVRVLVHHPQFVDAVSDAMTLSPGGTKEADVVLHAGGILEGRVVDAAGRGCLARASSAPRRAARLERVGRTASDGTFGFAAVPADVVLLVSPDDEGSPVELRAPVSVPEGDRTSITLAARPAPASRYRCACATIAATRSATAQVTVDLARRGERASRDRLHGRRRRGQPGARQGARASRRGERAGSRPRRRAPRLAATELVVTLALAESARGVVHSTRGDARSPTRRSSSIPRAGARRTRT